MGDRDAFRALGLAGSRVRAGAEAQLVHLGHHRLRTTRALDTALRQLSERRHASCDEQHGRSVLAGSHTGAASDARGRIHALVGIGLRNRNRIRVGHSAGSDRDETAGLQNLVERAAVDGQVLDNRKRARAPRLDGDRRRGTCACAAGRS